MDIESLTYRELAARLGVKLESEAERRAETAEAERDKMRLTHDQLLAERLRRRWLFSFLKKAG